MSTTLLSYAEVSVRLSRTGRNLFAPLSFDVARGELLVLSGRVGSGKSPALRAAIGAQAHTTGDVVCLENAISTLSAAALLQLRRRVGYVPRTGGLLSNLNLLDNLTLLWSYHDVAPAAEIRARAVEVCDQLGIGDLDGRSLASAGRNEQHLIAIGRAWLPHPPLLILDEPDFGLDDATAAQLWSRLATLRQRHDVAMLVATNRPRLALCDGGVHLPLQSCEAS